MPGSIKRARSWELYLSIIGITAAALAFAASLYLSRSINGALETLQKENNSARVASVIQALEQNVEFLADYTTGYSMWDDTYRFLESPTDDYTEKNYSADVIEVTSIRLVALYDLSGKLVLGLSYDEEVEPLPLPAGLDQAPDPELLAGLRQAGDYVGRVEWIGDHAYVTALCPVTDSNGTAPVSGYLLFGTLIGENFLTRLQNLTGLPIKLSPRRHPFEAEAVIPTRQLGDAGIRIERQSASQWRAQVLFPGDDTLQSSPLFETELPTSAEETGRQLGHLVSTVLLSVAAAFAAFVGLSLREGRRRNREIQHKVTEQRELQAARRNAEQMAERAEAADRAKSAFLAMMSHEIRTPLNAIVGYADLLREHPEDPEFAAKLEIISTSGGVLRHVLDDILDYSRIEAGQLLVERNPVLIRKAIGSVIDTFRHLADSKGNSITLNVAEDVPACLLIDDARLRQVLGNLLSNAAKFTVNGAITVSVTRGGPQPGSEASESPGEPTLRVEVEDTGIGISESDAAKLFTPFVQVDSSATRRFEGTGLGLAICRRLCKLMGGDIGFRRSPGGGSIFTVVIAAKEGKMPADRRTETQLLRTPFEELSILVVDDHKINTRLLTTILGRLGRTARTAESGEAAVEIFREHGADLVFMDIHMPGISGIEAAEQIREIERDRGAKRSMVAALTADILIQEEIRSKDGLFDEFLGKPFTVDQISRILAAASLVRAAWGAKPGSDAPAESTPAGK